MLDERNERLIDHGMEWIDHVDDASIDSALVSQISVDWTRKHRLLPVRYQDRIYGLGFEGSHFAALHDLGILLGDSVEPLLTGEAEWNRCVQASYFNRQNLAVTDEEVSDGGAGSRISDRQDQLDLFRTETTSPVSQLVNRYLMDAIRQNASDIHVEPGTDLVRIRFRIDGLLYEQGTVSKQMEAELISRLKVMGALDIAERRLPQDGMVKVSVGHETVDLRVSTVPAYHGERVVLRLLNTQTVLRPLDEIGMPGPLLSRFRDRLHRSYGAIWVTGPTGSGKTTTLYGALQELDLKHLNVMTVEDPVEYSLEGIGQISVKPKIGLTFAHGLRHILRQDPDVVLVGETRDLETAEIAVRASLTGHLVMSTLHTNDAVSAFVRLVDMGIPPYLVAASVQAVMAQRLIRRLCPFCRREIPSSSDKTGWQLTDAQRQAVTYEAVGCEKCRSGYHGRTGIYELVEAADPLLELVRSGAGMQAMLEQVISSHVPMMRDDGLDKVCAGVTSFDEVARVVGRDG
ncbi:MAG: type II/IV secretion system protein [Spartobacteria bacterium]|nr:type II/IV secretion system protein [Spartobacteria bacterium]